MMRPTRRELLKTAVAAYGSTGFGTPAERGYRESGRTEDAEAIDAELLKLLAVADSDHPVLLRLNKASR
jgi:hypothetical protein